jgi:Putative zinc-finger
VKHVRCDEATEGVSRALDGAVDAGDLDRLDAHVATCATCQAFRRSALRVRQHLRYEVVTDVLDVEAAVLDAVRRPPPRRLPTLRRPRPSLRWLAPAAALVAGIVAGATFIGVRTDRSPDVAAAADISSRVLAAQVRVEALHADVAITERGWHPDVRVRTYRGRLDYRAPESLAITLEDASAYPSKAWRRNNVATVVDRDRSWRGGLAACPREAQPSCTPDQLRILGATEREPFPDAAPAPLDLVVPVASFAGGGETASLGERRVAGRPAIGVEVTVAQVAPLLHGILGSGNWRDLHATDRARLWLDRESLVPLRLEVLAAQSRERDRWAAHRGYSDQPDTPIFEMSLRGVRTGEPGPIESSAAPEGALARSHGFHDLPPDQVAAPSPATLPPGMTDYRAGVVETPNGPQVHVRTWTDGRAWLKLRVTREWSGERLFGDVGGPVRAVDLGAAGTAYVGDGGRRVALHGPGVDAVVTGTVGEAALLDVASSIGVRGEPVPPTWSEAGTATTKQATRALPGLLAPRNIGGFTEPAIRVDGDVVTFAYAGAGSRAFELVEGPGGVLIPPVGVDVRGVEVRRTTGRYSPDRGELEWIEDGKVIALRSRTMSLGELVRIANQLEPA